MDTRFSISDDRRELSINNVEESVLGTYEVVATIGNETATDRIAIQIPGMRFYSCYYLEPVHVCALSME